MSRGFEARRGSPRRLPAAVLLALSALCAAPVGASAESFGFETGVEGWEAYDWDPGCTNVAQSGFWGYDGSAHSLRMDLALSSDGDKGWAGVMLSEQNLEGTTITIRVYCPINSSAARCGSDLRYQI